MLFGAAWRLRLPSRLGAVVLRAERFVFAAAPSPQPSPSCRPRNPSAERLANQWLRRIGLQSFRRVRAREDGARLGEPGGRGEGQLEPGDTAAREHASVRKRDASPLGPLSLAPEHRDGEFGPEEESIPLPASSTPAAAAGEGGVDLPGQGPRCASEVRKEGAHGCWKPLAGGLTCPKSLPDWECPVSVVQVCTREVCEHSPLESKNQLGAL